VTTPPPPSSVLLVSSPSSSAVGVSGSSPKEDPETELVGDGVVNSDCDGASEVDEGGAVSDDAATAAAAAAAAATAPVVVEADAHEKWGRGAARSPPEGLVGGRKRSATASVWAPKVASTPVGSGTTVRWDAQS